MTAQPTMELCFFVVKSPEPGKPYAVTQVTRMPGPWVALELRQKWVNEAGEHEWRPIEVYP